MNKADEVYIADIVDSIQFILDYVSMKSEVDFTDDHMVQDAVIRRLEIIGEAAAKVSDEMKNRTHYVKWGLIQGMRGKLVHEYIGVSAGTIYKTVYSDLPIIREQLNKLTTEFD